MTPGSIWETLLDLPSFWTCVVGGLFGLTICGSAVILHDVIDHLSDLVKDGSWWGGR